MPKQGGPANQSGIIYQNAIAALFLARMYNSSPNATANEVIEVRVEDPSYVDDIKIVFADHRCYWIQAKENITPNTKAWKKLWSDFAKQRWGTGFKSGDRLAFYLGNSYPWASSLREICKRAHGAANDLEWHVSISTNRKLSNLTKSVRELIPPQYQGGSFLYELFSVLDVEICTYEEIKNERFQYWMSPTWKTADHLFERFLKIAAEASRYQTPLHAEDIRPADQSKQELSEKIGNSKMEAYKNAFCAKYGYIGIPGTRMSGTIDELFIWPTLLEVHEKKLLEHDHEDDYSDYIQSKLLDPEVIENFPSPSLFRAVVIAGAGFGKTTLLRALAIQIVDHDLVPAFVSIAELASKKYSIVDYLTEHENKRFDVQISWSTLCAEGKAVLFLDGLDELAPDDRRTVLEHIVDFSSRYPSVAWLMSVRDIKAMPIAIPAKFLTIAPYNHEEINQFVIAYRKAGGGYSIHQDELSSLMDNYHDVESLAKIPLFLGLMLAIAKDHISLPRNRRQVLGHYLHILLHPKEYKPGDAPVNNPYQLQKVAESLAYEALLDGKLGFSIWEAQSILREIVHESDLDSYLVDFSKLGLMNRSATWISFTFPTIQEYLASSRLISLEVNEFVAQFNKITKRPWAQALQFALERHPQAELIVTKLLEQSDDAFFSMFRLLARCVANGANVSTHTRNKMQEQLFNLWTTKGTFLSSSAARLLADGFLQLPISKHIREHLIFMDRLAPGAEELLNAVRNPDLTCSVIEELLNPKYRSVSFYPTDLEPAIEQAATRILHLVVQKSKDKTLLEHELNTLSFWIHYLHDTGAIPPEEFSRMAQDDSLHDLIRLEGYLLGGHLISEEALPIIDSIFRSDVDFLYLTRGWESSLRALWKCESAVVTWKSYVRDMSLPDHANLEIMTSILFSSLDEEDRITLLAELAKDPSSPLDTRHRALLLLGNEGDVRAMQEVTEQLPSLLSENLYLWSEIIGMFKGDEVVFRGLDILEAMDKEHPVIIEVAFDLHTGVSHEVYLHGTGGTSGGILYSDHPAEQRVAQLFWESATRWGRDVRPYSYIILMRFAADLGHSKAKNDLISGIKYYLRKRPEEFLDEHSGNAISNAIEGVLQSELPIKTLVDIARVSDGDAAHSALSAIGSRAKLEALEAIIKMYNSPRFSHIRRYAFGEIDDLSGRLGIRVVKRGRRLVIDTPE